MFDTLSCSDGLYESVSEPGLLRSCLEQALHTKQPGFFRELFSWGWHHQYLTPADGEIYLTAAMRANDTELLHFLLDQGVRLKLDDPVLQKSVSNERNFDAFRLRNLDFASSPSAKLVELLFRSVTSDTASLNLAAWMVYWAIGHHDIELLKTAQARAFGLSLPSDSHGSHPYVSYLPALVNRALETGNLDALSLLGRQLEGGVQVDALRTYLKDTDLQSIRWPDGSLSIHALNQKTLEFYCELYSSCEGKAANESWSWRRQDLLLAVSGENPETLASESGIRYLLAKGAEPDPPNGAKTAAMFLAKAQNGSLALMQELHRAGADLKRVYGGTQNLLYFAAQGGNPEIVSWLLAQGLRLDTGVTVGQEAKIRLDVLKAAIIQGNPKSLELLLASLAPADIPPYLAALAIREGRPELAQALSRYGTALSLSDFIQISQDLNEDGLKTLFDQIQDPAQRQDLLKAVEKEAMSARLRSIIGHPLPPSFSSEAYRLDLYPAGYIEAFMHQRSRFLLTALELAFKREGTRTWAWAHLLQAMDYVLPAEQPRLERWFDEGLRSGLNPDAMNQVGRTILQQAIVRREPERVKRLVQAGADIEFIGTHSYGYTPLQLAASNPNEAIVRLLLERGASPQAIGKITDDNPDFSHIPLAEAIGNAPSPEADAVLWTLLPLTNLAEPEHRRLLFTAVESGRLDMVKRLARHHELGLKDRAGRTLLFYASGPKAGEMIAYLISKGLDVNHINHLGDTPLTNALYDFTGRASFDSLLSHGADPCLGNPMAYQERPESFKTRYSETYANQRLAELRKSCNLSG